MKDLLVFIVKSPTGEEYFHIITDSLEKAKIKVAKFIANDKYFKKRYEFFKRISWEFLESSGWSIHQLYNVIYKGSHDIIKSELYVKDELIV